MAERDRIRPDPDPDPGSGISADGADADRGPEPDDGASGPQRRDPTALAAWRRVAEQRRRRRDAIGPARPVPPRPDTTPSVRSVIDLGQAGSATSAGPGPVTPGPAAADEPPRRHDLLLGIAGRIDDDALATVRELVAVGDEAAAAELLGGCLLSGRVPVSDRERGALAQWFSAARVDPALVDALPADPDATQRSRHRFVVDLPSTDVDDGDAIARAAVRLSGVSRVLQCWRVTPAGSTPGPLPHRVVLVETEALDDCEHVVHHVAHAARALGTVSVEVFARSSSLPAYQRDALAASTGTPVATPDVPATSGTPDVSGTPVGPGAPDVPGTSGAVVPEATVAPEPVPVVRPDTDAAGLPARRRPGAGASLFAPIPTFEGGPGHEFAPGPGPVPERVPEKEPEEPSPAERADEWRVVADADRGVPTVSEPALPEPDEPARAADRGTDVEHDAQGRPTSTDISDMSPEEAAARIAALWREPSSVDALDAPFDSDAHQPNLLEPDLPEPDLGAELSRYGREAAEFSRLSPGSSTGPSTGPSTEPVSGVGPGATGAEPGRHHYAGVDPEPTLADEPAPGAGIVRRARHSRTGSDDGGAAGWDPGDPGHPDPGHPDPGHPDAGHPDATGRNRDVASPTGPGRAQDPATQEPTTRDQAPRDRLHQGQAPAAPPSSEPATAPVVAYSGTGPADPPRTDAVGWSADTEDAVNSQLSDRERDLLARLHAELASRERLDDDQPDPFAASAAAGRPSPSPRPRTPSPSPSPRNGHRHTNGHRHAGGATNGQVNGHVNGHGLHSGHARSSDPDPGDEAGDPGNSPGDR